MTASPIYQANHKTDPRDQGRGRGPARGSRPAPARVGAFLWAAMLPSRRDKSIRLLARYSRRQLLANAAIAPSRVAS
jgi:hypothetical protein